MKLLKESIKTKAPRKTLPEVENSVGSVLKAHSTSDLPRDRKQVDNLKYAPNNQQPVHPQICP